MTTPEQIERAITRNHTTRVFGAHDKLREVIQDHVNRHIIRGPDRILEIGTHHGATTARLAGWFPDAFIDTINGGTTAPARNQAKSELPIARKLWDQLKLTPRIKQHLGDSVALLSRGTFQPYDVIIVDGLHEAKQVNEETRIIRKSLITNPATLVIYDDTNWVNYELPFEYDGSHANFSWKLFIGPDKQESKKSQKASNQDEHGSNGGGIGCLP